MCALTSRRQRIPILRHPLVVLFGVVRKRQIGDGIPWRLRATAGVDTEGAVARGFGDVLN
jgi:hypothetical protein